MILTPEDHPRVRVEQRPNYHNGLNLPAPDWIAFAAGDRTRRESAPTAELAVEKLRVSHPDLFAPPVDGLSVIERWTIRKPPGYTDSADCRVRALGERRGAPVYQGEVVVIPESQMQGAVKTERERIANMLARDADSDERGGFDERTRTVLRSYARSIATGGQ